MKMMLKFTIPVEKGNEAEARGKLAPAIRKLVEDSKAECAYFYMYDGERAGHIVFDCADASVLPSLNEPFMAATDAAINIHPVLTTDDLMKSID